MSIDLDRLLTLTAKAKKHIEPLLLKLGTHRWSDVEDAIIRGDLHLVSTDNAAAVGEIIDYPLKRIFKFHWAGGKKKELKAIQRQLEHWALEQGCEAVQITGRRGWIKEYKDDFDHDKVMVTLQKDLLWEI